MLQPQQLAVPRTPVRLELAHFALVLTADLVLARPEEFELLGRLGRTALSVEPIRAQTEQAPT
jgi:hypothetical protein